MTAAPVLMPVIILRRRQSRHADDRGGGHKQRGSDPLHLEFTPTPSA
jgi:hypothetical protein